MNTLEAITNETLETVNGGRAPLCNLSQRAAIRQRAESGARTGMWAGAGLGLIAGGFTPIGVGAAAAGSVAGAVIGDKIGERRGQLEQGCRL
jgi:hypothetical protein